MDDLNESPSKAHGPRCTPCDLPRSRKFLRIAVAILRGWEMASKLEGAGAGSEGFNSADAQDCLAGEGAGLETRVWDI